MVGDEVNCYCNVEAIGRTSVTMKIENWARRRLGNEPIKVTEGVLTQVRVDSDGKPLPIAAAPQS